MKPRWWLFILASAAFIVGVAVLMRVAKRDEAWHPWDGEGIVRDLDSMRADTLRLLVMDDPLVWENGPKGGTGLAYEWMERFAKAEGLRLSVVISTECDTLLAWLWQGKGDLVIAPVPEQHGYARHFAYTDELWHLDPYIATQRPEVGSDGHSSITAAHDSVLISRSSSFAAETYRFERGQVPAASQAINSRTEEDLFVDLVLGEGSRLVVNGLRAGHAAKRFPLLQFEGPVGQPIPWRFMTRRDSPALLEALNGWIAKDSGAREQLVRAFTDPMPPPGPLRPRRMKAVDRDSISPFDHYFRSHADGLSFDWRLLAAMAWKESRFDSTVTSHKGAMGIMQIMPRTAARLGLDTSSVVDDHIRAAARYIARMDTLWMRAVPDREQRLRFVLASYNAGPGHIIDAQRLAGQLGLDPMRWEGHVERAVLLLAKPRYFMRPEMKNGYCKGSQVFHYVRGVLAVYAQLKRA